MTAFGAPTPSVNLASLVPDEAIDASIRISSLDRWTKIEQIGQGKFGEVWRYETEIDGTPTTVAGKHLKVQLWNLNRAQREDLEKRVHAFVKELNVLNKVSSECSERFVQFKGCYLDSNMIILFTEYMEHGSIRNHINERPLDEAIALKFTFQAAQGLNFLHHYKEERIVHRDIKCDNLLLTSEDNVKLADFGLAHSLQVDGDSYTMSLGAPSGVAGTLKFAAPEVLVDTKYGRRADIWSLGCTLVEMLTMQAPHTDFFTKHKERAQFLFLERAQADSAHQLQYIGKQLAPRASPAVHKLLDCLFIKNKRHRPRSDDVLGVFESVPSSPTLVRINVEKLDELQHRISEEEKYYNAYKALS